MNIESNPQNYSEHLLRVLDELVASGSLSKDHFFINSLAMEDKYELIRLESLGLLSIKEGSINALETFTQWSDSYRRQSA